MTTNQNTFKNTDKGLLLLYLVLVFIGWLNIYAAEYNEVNRNIFDLSTSYGKQLIFIGTSLVIGLAVFIMDVRFFTGVSWVIYGFCLLLLVAVLFVGVEINATKAWFRVGSLSFQPSELAKYGTALALAAFLNKTKSTKTGIGRKVRAFAIILIPAAMVLLQKDVGTTLVFASFSFVLFREGYIGGLVLFFAGVAITLFVLTLIVNEFLIIGALAAVMLIIGYFLRKKVKALLQLTLLFFVMAFYVYSVDYTMENILEPHHKARIEVLLHKGFDLQGVGYNLHQSKIAIGSGGLTGKGFLQGTQTQFNFVPEQTTDFIFCTIGEEWGFVGSTIIIGLYLFLLLRIIFVAERQKSTFSRVFGYSVASIIFFHFAINIGMTIGLVPVIGIPLPLVSYGGSSLWGVSLMLFTFMKLDAKRLDLL
ncbi:MAG: rod shape-determining protein RodA [Bacteroidales bacterium]|nr:rod shape-determining protein RodA [Bacteroidales bacterium]